jgi:Lon protease-like protein
MEIPLFPLPNLVLFPQVAVPLHIFEERYKLMINRCIDKEEVFGLVLLRADAEEERESTIHRIGVTSRVMEVDRLQDGRMNILCAGESRFRIVRFTGKSPYWTAAVELFDDEEEPSELLQPSYEEVARLYKQTMDLTAQLRSSESTELTLPESPVALSYVVSYVLDVEPEKKQLLLETTSTLDRLQSLIPHLEENLKQLETQIARKEVAHKVRGNGDLGRPKDIG